MACEVTFAAYTTICIAGLMLSRYGNNTRGIRLRKLPEAVLLLTQVSEVCGYRPFPEILTLLTAVDLQRFIRSLIIHAFTF